MNVDMSKVDLVDTAIDGTAFAGDLVTIGSLLLGQPGIALVSEVLGDIVGTVGVIKGAYDLFETHDAGGLLSGEFSRALSKTTLNSNKNSNSY